MPTATFFNLPKEKQKRLLEAAKAEFTRAPLNEASISNIVKLAGIPRGSFYQYFEGKEDLYFYYFDQLRRDTKLEFEKAVRDAKGDILQASEVYLSRMIREILTGENSAFFKNLFMNMDFRSSEHISAKLNLSKEELKKQQEQRKMKQERTSIWSLVDRDRLRIADEEEFRMFMHMLMSQMFMTIAHGYRRMALEEDYSAEDSIRDFQTQLSWFRKGIYLS